jgi:signal transduction histidine kinase
LRARLIFLVLLAVIPAVMITALSGTRQRDLARRNAEESTQQLARSIASYHASLIEAGRQMLLSISFQPEMLSDNARCTERLAELNRRFPMYIALTLVGPDGLARCSSVALEEPLKVSDRDYFQRATTSGEFAVGEVTIGRLTGQAITPLALPLRGADGELSGVLVGALDLSQLETQFTGYRLPESSVLILVDEQGTVLLRYPEGEWIGQRLPEAPIVREILTSGGEGRAEVAGVDGVNRLYSFTRLSASSDLPVYAAVGVPSAAVYAEANRLYRVSLVWLIVISLLALTVAWFGGDVFFLRVVSLTAERDQAEAELRRINQGLEQRVAERTADLTVANERLSVELEQRARAEALADQRAREAEEGRRILEAMLEFIPEGIVVADAPEVSVRFISRYGQDQAGWITGAPVVGAASSQDDRQMLDARNGQPVSAADLPLNRAIQQGETITNEEWMLQQANGERRFLLVNAGPIRDAAGAIVGGVIAWHDVTDRKRIELEVAEYAGRLERSNRDLQDFAYVASHDLQEPLRKIQAFGERLQNRHAAGLGEEGGDFVGRMVGAANRMQLMVNDLLSYSRVNSRGSAFKAVNLGEVLNTVLADLELRIQDSGGQVSVGPLPVIEADDQQMHQLFLNLVGNALKFHKPGQPPRVRVSAQIVRRGWRPEDQSVQVKVEDEGIGFDEKYLDRIFQPFQRLHNRGEYEGSGIGLSICRKIVERHAGVIQVSSKPDEGACFTITLPIAHPKPIREVE